MVEAAGIDLLNLLGVITIAWLCGTAAERVGYPALMGELLARVLFGPALLGVLRPAPELEVFAELGVFLLMLYVGMEVDIHDLFRLGPLSVMVAVGGFALCRRVAKDGLNIPRRLPRTWTVGGVEPPFSARGTTVSPATPPTPTRS